MNRTTEGKRRIVDRRKKTKEEKKTRYYNIFVLLRSKERERERIHPVALLHHSGELREKK